jgi:phage shock protein E
MNLVTWIVIAGAVVAFLLLKRLSLVTPAAAREWLNQGALVIDVRSEGEFQERHLPGAINIPLGRLGDEITRRAPDKEQALLLHCLSGTRSGMAKARLKQMGYRHVFNLGSYGRAEKILGAQSGVGRKG